MWLYIRMTHWWFLLDFSAPWGKGLYVSCSPFFLQCWAPSSLVSVHWLDEWINEEFLGMVYFLNFLHVKLELSDLPSLLLIASFPFDLFKPQIVLNIAKWILWSVNTSESPKFCDPFHLCSTLQTYTLFHLVLEDLREYHIS